MDLPDAISGDTVGGDKVGGDTIGAQQSQGLVNQPSGPVSQTFGEQTNIDTGGGHAIDSGGGDVALKGDIDKRQGSTFVEGDVHSTIIAQQHIYQSTSVFQPLHQLRAPVGDFVGREQEIDQLIQALTKAGGAAAAISGVRGMGGIGKTELAYKVADQLKQAFPDAQLVVKLHGASSPITPEQALQVVIRAFERETKLPDDLDQLKALYNAVLSGKRVLILADDARDATQVRPLLPPRGCALLRARSSHPGARARPQPPRHGPKSQQPGLSTPRSGQLCRRSPLLRARLGDC
jgi:hypothetical protein